MPCVTEAVAEPPVAPAKKQTTNREPIAGHVTRPLKVEVYIPHGDALPPDEAKKIANTRHRALLNDIALYRATCREMAAILATAELAACDIVNDEAGVRVVAKTENGQKVLQTIFDLKKRDGTTYDGKTPGYPLRDLIKSRLPDWRGDFADSVRADVWTKWKAKDAKIVKAQRRFLFWQGKRGTPIFGRQPIPLRPRWVKVIGHDIHFAHKTDDTVVHLRTSTLDTEAWNILKKIASGEFEMGTVLVNDNDGKLYLIFSYQRPGIAEATLQAGRVLEVGYNEDPAAFLQFKVVSGAETLIDKMRGVDLSAAAAVAGIDGLRIQMDKIEKLIESCGNKHEQRRGEGNKKAFEKYQRSRHALSRQRDNFTKTWNHTWAKRCASVASSWHCGTVKVYVPADLFKRTWPWSDFEGKLKYRCDEAGVKVEIVRAKDTAVAGILREEMKNAAEADAISGNGEEKV